MAYYRDIVTDQSWKLLTELAQAYEFTLIGGWAVWVYTNALKSKDIDIIIDLPTLGKLREVYEIAKNDRLKKYEIITGIVHIDIYVPYWSNLGIPINLIRKDQRNIQGFQIPNPETLLILKQIAYAARIGSAKGEKDLLDIISILTIPGFSWHVYKHLVTKTTLPKIQLTDILTPIVDIPELSLNRHTFSRLKKQLMRELRK